jgi:hypothetical protein
MARIDARVLEERFRRILLRRMHEAERLSVKARPKRATSSPAKESHLGTRSERGEVIGRTAAARTAENREVRKRRPLNLPQYGKACSRPAAGRR